jgi:hypothetical protein
MVGFVSNEEKYFKKEISIDIGWKWSFTDPAIEGFFSWAS